MRAPRKVMELDDYGQPDLRLGNLYRYELVDYPFMGKRTVKGTRWVVPAKNASGSMLLYKGDSDAKAVAEYKFARQKDSSIKETTLQQVNIGNKLDEKWSAVQTVKAENFFDLGVAVVEIAGQSVVLPDVTGGATNWWASVAQWWQNLWAGRPGQIR